MTATIAEDRRAATPAGRAVPTAWIAIAAAVLPIVIAAARTLRRGYVALGDDSLILIRIRDVGTANNPRLGTWSSASLVSGTPMNHPGPLLFDVLALPVRVLGGPVGLVVGVSALNAACVIGAILAARRIAGDLGAALVGVAAGGIAWSMGSELLIDVWQPHVLILPFLCFLVVIWGTATGHLRFLPLALGIGSLLVQTHLSYAYVVPVLLLIAIGAAASDLRRARREDEHGWPTTRRRARRVGMTAAVVLVLAWIQPLLEQFTSPGDGNVTRLLTSAGGEQVNLGPRLGVRVVAAVVTLPPWWTRWGFDGAVPTSVLTDRSGQLEPVAGSLPNFGLSLASVVVLLGLLAVARVVARRRSDRVAGRLLVVIGVAVMVPLVAALVTPVGLLGLSSHQMRWLWPISAMVMVALALVAVRARRQERGVLLGCLALAILLGGANVPTSVRPHGPTADRDATEPTQALTAQLGALEGRGTLLFEPKSLSFGEPWSGPVLADLQRRRVPFVVDDEGFVRQLGEARRNNGRARERFFILDGPLASTVPPGAERVAFVPGLTEDEKAELTDLNDKVATIAEEKGLRLTGAGRQASAVGTLGVAPAKLERGGDGVALVASGWPASGIRRGLVVTDGPDEDVLRRYAELEYARIRLTVAVFVSPIERSAQTDGAGDPNQIEGGTG